MQLIISLVFLFAAGALTGWLIELIFRRFVSQKSWVNPGFLNGPYLPLYGVSTIALYSISHLVLPLWLKIMLFIVVPTGIELITGLIFVNWFNIKLWDYSDQWGNFKGIICPLFTVFWGILGAIFNLIIYPILFERLDFLMSHIELSFFVGIFLGIFILDCINSFDVANQIKKVLSETEERVQVNYEKLKLEAREWASEHTNRGLHQRYMSTFNGKARPALRETVERQVERFKQSKTSAERLLKMRRKER